MWRNANSINHQYFSELLDFVYPPFCLTCDKPVEIQGELICEECWKRLTGHGLIFCINCRQILTERLICKNCHDQNNFPVLALGHYVSPLKDLIHLIKYQGYRNLAYGIIERLFPPYIDIIQGVNSNLLTPIPLGSYRQKKRGFNQAALLADIIMKRVNVPSFESALRKARVTKDQTKLDILQREKNMNGAFVSNPDWVNGKSVILVDDVITTGATLRDAARAINSAGGRTVVSLVIAAA
jgi:ComF family protein